MAADTILGNCLRVGAAFLTHDTPASNLGQQVACPVCKRDRWR